MLDELLKADVIPSSWVRMYRVFELTEDGRTLLQEATISYFMEEPDARMASGEQYAFMEGRRSYLREVRRAIDCVREKLKELDHVGQQPESTKSE